MKNWRFALAVIITAIIINLCLPQIVLPFATDAQKNPPSGAANLSFFDQIVHMLVHHAQVPFTSTLIVVLITCLSLTGGYYLAKLF